jgi:hypothetical protein
MDHHAPPPYGYGMAAPSTFAPAAPAPQVNPGPNPTQFAGYGDNNYYPASYNYSGSYYPMSYSYPGNGYYGFNYFGE